MTDGKPPKLPPPLRDRWPLLPPLVAKAILGVLYAALDRRPPFEAIARPAFDLALTKLPPPPNLTREQVRRGIFEELNYLPWSEGLEPPEGGSWLRHAPVATGVDRVFVIPADPYSLTRKVAKVVADRMRADGTLGPGVGVDVSGNFDVYRGLRGNVRVWHRLRASYRVLPLVHSEVMGLLLRQATLRDPVS